MRPGLYLVEDKGKFDELCKEAKTVFFGNINKGEHENAVYLVRKPAEGVNYVLITQPTILEERIKLSVGPVALDILPELVNYMMYLNRNTQDFEDRAWVEFYRMCYDINEDAHKKGTLVYLLLRDSTPEKWKRQFTNSFHTL